MVIVWGIDEAIIFTIFNLYKVWSLLVMVGIV